jgi:hypothetical protein
VTDIPASGVASAGSPVDDGEVAPAGVGFLLGVAHRARRRAWEAAIADCVAQWAALFPGLDPHTAPAIDRYVTENCDDFALNPPRRRKPPQP